MAKAHKKALAPTSPCEKIFGDRPEKIMQYMVRTLRRQTKAKRRWHKQKAPLNQ